MSAIYYLTALLDKKVPESFLDRELTSGKLAVRKPYGKVPELKLGRPTTHPDRYGLDITTV